MVCERYSRALSDVAAGGPAPDGFDAHLRGCADCRAELVLMRRALANVDQQMKELAAAEPSAAFVARVRGAVLESASASAWRMGWIWPSFATAVVAGLVVMVANHPAHQAIAPVQAQLPGPLSPADIDAAVRGPALASAAAETRETSPRHRRIRSSAAAEPPVLVPPGESAALVEFIARVNRDGLAPAALQVAGEPAGRLAMLSPIDIKPIEIVPLDTAMNPGT